MSRHVQTKVRQFDEDARLLNEFVAAVKSECIAAHEGQKTFFTFDAVPDCIVRRKYTRENYEKIKKHILKVKQLFLKAKAAKRKQEAEREKERRAEMGDVAFDDGASNRKSVSHHTEKDKGQDDVITDEDYVHFDYLQMVIDSKERKEIEMRTVWERFIQSVKVEREEQFSKFKDEGPKKKKLID